MSPRSNRVVSGALGGMVGGAAMALALTGVERIAWQRMSRARRARRGIRALFTRSAPRMGQADNGTVVRRVAQSAMLGAVYGALRSGFNLPRFIFGPVFGIATYGLSQVGMAPSVEEVPGPWNKGSMSFLPRMLTQTLYGVVTDAISERVQNMLG